MIQSQHQQCVIKYNCSELLWVERILFWLQGHMATNISLTVSAPYQAYY